MLKQIFKTERSKNALKDVLHNLVDDSSINTIVTYKQHKIPSTAYNPESQSVGTSRWTNFTGLNALKSYFTEFEKFLAGGSVELGDVRFIINKDDVVNTPSPEDRIVETKNQSGVTYNIVTYDADPLGMAYVFHCRRP